MKIRNLQNLVCRNESAGHPLRRMLPPPKFDMALIANPPAPWWKKEDTHLFVMSFAAFFVVFSTFIA
jgi:hypothetical protein